MIFAVDSELKVEAPTAGRRNLIAVEGGEDLVERLGLVWVKACPEGTGGRCLLFNHHGQFLPWCFFLCCSPWLPSASTVKDADVGVKRAQAFGAEFFVERK